MGGRGLQGETGITGPTGQPGNNHFPVTFTSRQCKLKLSLYGNMQLTVKGA